MSFQRTPRGTTILFLSAIFVTLGLFEIGGSTVVLVYAGIGLFLYYYTSRLVFGIKIAALNKLQVSREYDKRITEDEPVEISLVLVNQTFMGLRTEILDSYPPFFRLKDGSNTALVGVPGKGYSKIHYGIAPTSIGSHKFGAMHLVTRDLAGLFFYERNAAGNNSIEVTPRGKEIERGALTATISTYAGPLTSRRKGEGMEFADIREYNFGDPYKRIEWKSTARTGELMVREMHAETQLNVMILLDSTESMAYGEAGQTKLDYAARSVASLISYLSRRGDFFGLTVVQGTAPAKVIPLARGQVQTARILQQLSLLSPADGGPHGIGEAVRRSLALGRIKGRTLFFVVSDLETEADLYSLRQLSAMSHEAVIISPYTPLFEAHGLQGLDKIVFAIRTSHQWRTRRKLLHEAASMGVPLFDVGPKDLFPQLVMRVEELRRRGGS